MCCVVIRAAYNNLNLSIDFAFDFCFRYWVWFYGEWCVIFSPYIIRKKPVLWVGFIGVMIGRLCLVYSRDLFTRFFVSWDWFCGECSESFCRIIFGNFEGLKWVWFRSRDLWLWVELNSYGLRWLWGWPLKCKISPYICQLF